MHSHSVLNGMQHLPHLVMPVAHKISDDGYCLLLEQSLLLTFVRCFGLRMYSDVFCLHENFVYLKMPPTQIQLCTL
jgi:hypothetical protein